MINGYGVEITKKIWKKCFMTKVDHDSVIEMCDIGLSEFISKWDIHLHIWKDFLQKRICLRFLFEEIFLKYGGDVFRKLHDQLESIHWNTVKNVKDCEKAMKINWIQV